MHAQASTTGNIIRKKAVVAKTGLSETTIWREEKAGRFPGRVQITANAVGWFEDEINAWVHERIRGSKLISPNPRAHQHMALPESAARSTAPQRRDATIRPKLSSGDRRRS